jgi:hypothetical protein
MIYQIEIGEKEGTTIFQGNFEAKNEKLARSEALDYYAMELNTDIENLEILSINLIK